MENLLNWWCDPWNFLSGVMSLVALLGTIMNAERNKWGFVFWVTSNIYMSIRFFVIGEYAQSVLFFVYFLLAVKGIFSWSSKEEKDRQAIEKAAKSGKVE